MNADKTVAIYWDFENIHAGVFENTYGVGEYAKSPKPTQIAVSVQAILDYADTHGVIAINKAYCNWQWFGRYREDLLRGSVELIQIFPPGSSAKNGADIKLSLDALEDCIRLPHISTVIVVGGDSDFLPLAQKIKAFGKRLIGIGCYKNTNRFWANSCTKFSYYEDIVRAKPQDAAETLPTDECAIEPARDDGTPQVNQSEAARIVADAVLRLQKISRGDPINKAAIIPTVKRAHPTFQVSNYGYRDLTHLLNSHPDKFLVSKGDADHVISLRSFEESA